jgi:hypothetical protein
MQKGPEAQFEMKNSADEIKILVQKVKVLVEKSPQKAATVLSGWIHDSVRKKAGKQAA